MRAGELIEEGVCDSKLRLRPQHSKAPRRSAACIAIRAAVSGRRRAVRGGPHDEQLTADIDRVAGMQRRRAVDAYPIDERSVFAAEVFECELVRQDSDARVVSRDQGGVQADGNVFAPPDDMLSLRQRVLSVPVNEGHTVAGWSMGRKRYRCDEPVAEAGNGLDVLRCIGDVAQGLSNFRHGAAQRLLTNHDVSPDLFEKLLSGDESAAFPDEIEEEMQALRAQLDAKCVAA